MRWRYGGLFLLTYFAMLTGLRAQELDFNQISSLAKMSRAISSSDLIKEKKLSGKSYRARVIFAARFFELHPNDINAANNLLGLIPRDNAQQVIWITFGDSLCDKETVSDMTSLGKQGERLSYDLAKAVLLNPRKMSDYLVYAFRAAQVVDSDYAVHMQVVCRDQNAIFLEVLGEMPSEKRKWFVKYILNPEECRAYSVPEAN